MFKATEEQRKLLNELVHKLQMYCHVQGCEQPERCPECHPECRQKLELDTAIAWAAAICANMVYKNLTNSFNPDEVVMEHAYFTIHVLTSITYQHMLKYVELDAMLYNLFCLVDKISGWQVTGWEGMEGL